MKDEYEYGLARKDALANDLEMKSEKSILNGIDRAQHAYWYTVGTLLSQLAYPLPVLYVGMP